jgi:hypothetical protein
MNFTSLTMRRSTQLWIGGAAVALVGVGSFVVLSQKAQITEQKQSIEQQALVAKLLKDRGEEEERFRQQESAVEMQLKNLDTEHAKNAATASADRASLAASQKSLLDRQQLESKIQDLKAQQAERGHQTDCMLMQMRVKIAETAQDSDQAKALKDKWNAKCVSS